MKETIQSMMPATDWFAVTLWSFDDGPQYEVEPLVAWALVKTDGDSCYADEDSETSIRGYLAVDGRSYVGNTDENDTCENGRFLCYAHKSTIDDDDESRRRWQKQAEEFATKLAANREKKSAL